MLKDKKTKNLTREDICKKIENKMNVDSKKSKIIVEQIFSLMMESLVTDNSLKVCSFGTFKVLSKKERIGRNLKTGEEVMICARKSVSFSPSQKFKDKII